VTVIIPRILSAQLREVDDLQGRILALAYGERAIIKCRDMLEPSQSSSSLAYIAAARSFVLESSDISRLADAHASYFAERGDDNSLSARTTWIAAIAVAASCQRAMEEAGILAKKSYVPDLMAVAKEAQAVVGKCASTGLGVDDKARREVGRRARWDEAKWQLLQLIETVPFPGD
jgi:hypothetical protein